MAENHLENLRNARVSVVASRRRQAKILAEASIATLGTPELRAANDLVVRQQQIDAIDRAIEDEERLMSES